MEDMAETTMVQPGMLSSSMTLSNATSSEELNGDHISASVHLPSHAVSGTATDDPANGTVLTGGNSTIDFTAANDRRGDVGGSTSTMGAAIGGHEQSNDTGFADAGTGGKEGGSRPAKRPREPPQQVQQLRLPRHMVRRIMKLGEDTRNISNEALVIVTYASELFLERFAAQAFNHAEKQGRKTIKYQDVSEVRAKDSNLLFLEAVVPP